MKPGNLLVRPDGHVVLIDFGVARSSDATAAPLTGVNEVVGTALYMAPEQVAKRPITPATDIYALGAVAYHCLAGAPAVPRRQRADRGHAPPRRRAAAAARRRPRAVRALVVRRWRRTRADRFPTAAAMADAARTGADTADTVVTPGGAVPAARAAAPAGDTPAGDARPATRSSARGPYRRIRPPTRPAGGPVAAR